MRVGLFPVPVTAQVGTIQELSRRADQSSIHSVWIPEPHLLAFASYESEFPYADDGKMPEEYGEAGELDGFMTLSYLAAATERLRLGIGVCVVPQREPISLAKMVTTLDHLSGGRFDFGVGLGWLAEEFRAVGASFSDRAARCGTNLQLMEALWARDRAPDDPRLPADVAGAVQEPYPVQRPHPPIHFGGNGRRALERVVRFGQGWLPWNLGPEEIREGIVLLERLLAAAERERREIEVSVAVTQPLEDIDLAGYFEAGVDQILVVISPMSSSEQVAELFERLTAAGLIEERAGELA